MQALLERFPRTPGGAMLVEKFLLCLQPPFGGESVGVFKRTKRVGDADTVQVIGVVATGSGRICRLVKFGNHDCTHYLVANPLPSPLFSEQHGGMRSSAVPDVVPDAVPVLSRGKHRHPGKGACFMEFASYLAGERWSDHPACTHALLASVARLVNDFTTDGGRQRLASLIPSVVDLTGDDPHIDVMITLRAATTALPVVAAERQRVMAVAILAAERVLDELDERPPGTLTDRSHLALCKAPDAYAWAEKFGRHLKISTKGFYRQTAPHTVAGAVDGIARACVHDPDALLYGLLAGAIDDVSMWSIDQFDSMSDSSDHSLRISGDSSSSAGSGPAAARRPRSSTST